MDLKSNRLYLLLGRYESFLLFSVIMNYNVDYILVLSFVIYIIFSKVVPTLHISGNDLFNVIK